MTVEQLETAMLIQAGAFTLLAAALIALSVFVIRLTATLETIRRQLGRLLPSPSPASLHDRTWPSPVRRA